VNDSAPTFSFIPWCNGAQGVGKNRFFKKTADAVIEQLSYKSHHEITRCLHKSLKSGLCEKGRIFFGPLLQNFLPAESCVKNQ
jgi:hypothetical protein